MRSPIFQAFLLIVCIGFGLWAAVQSYNGLEGSSTVWRFVGPAIVFMVATGLAAKLLQFLEIMKPEVLEEVLDTAEDQNRD